MVMARGDGREAGFKIAAFFSLHVHTPKLE